MWITRHKTLVIAIVLYLVALVVVFGVVLPMYQNASTTLSKIKTKSTELDSLNTKVSLLTKLDPNVLAERVKILDSALPPKKDILLYLNSIDGLAKELGLSFGGLSLTPGELTEATASAKKATKTLGLQSLETEIKMRGAEENVYVFLRTIESVLPLMQIKDVKVSVLGDNQFSLTLTLAMLWAEPAVADVKGPITLFGTEEDKYFNQLSEYKRYDSQIASPVTSVGKQDLFTPFVEEVTPPQ